MSWLSRWFGKGTDSIERIPNAERPPAHASAIAATPAREPQAERIPVGAGVSESTSGEGYTHPPFTEEVRDILREIKMSLDDVYCLSVAEWEDRFRREPDAAREIASWVLIAKVYRDLTSEAKHDRAAKRELFHVLEACPHHSRDEVLSTVSLHALPRDEAEEAVATFFRGGRRA